MPFNNTQLDNKFPPIWKSKYASGKTVGGVAATSVDGTVQSANTALRPTTGDDPANYDRKQRVEGDLFHRDLVVAEVLQTIINYLGQRTGFTFSSPSVLVPAGKHVVIGYIGNSQTSAVDYDAFFVAAASVYSSSATSCGVRIVNNSGTIVDIAASSGNTGNIMQSYALSILAMTSGDMTVISGVGIEVQLYNESASTRTMAATIVLSPRTEAITPP